MKHLRKWLIWLWLPTMVLVWFLTPNSQTPWVKPTVFFVTMLVQGLIFGLVSRAKPQEEIEPYFGLTEKLYSMTLFAAMGIYTKGVWEITPDSHPSWGKHLFLGLCLAILVICFLYFAFKKVHEQPDERFYADLSKAACLTLVFIIGSLVILSMVTFFLPFTLRAGMILIYAATMIILFDVLFLIFEKRG